MTESLKATAELMAQSGVTPKYRVTGCAIFRGYFFDAEIFDKFFGSNLQLN